MAKKAASDNERLRLRAMGGKVKNVGRIYYVCVACLAEGLAQEATQRKPCPKHGEAGGSIIVARIK